MLPSRLTESRRFAERVAVSPVSHLKNMFKINASFFSSSLFVPCNILMNRRNTNGISAVDCDAATLQLGEGKFDFAF